MKICFPARKKGGKDYISVDDIMTQVLGEPHGGWLAGSNLLWHGGLHISTVTAPDSVLTEDTANTAVPLQFMAGGDVVAWRLNKDYLTSQYNGKTLQYSTTFVLVKSVCQPDPKNDKTWLEFYTLYMGLAPLSEFPKTACWSVTDKGDGLRKRQYSGAEKEGRKAPIPAGGSLKKGTCVAVMKQTAFELDGKSQPFGLAKVLNEKGEITGKPFWVSLAPDYMKKGSPRYAHLPAWMQQAVKQGTFDEVVRPAAKLEVAAGDAAGFLSKDVDPVGMGKVGSSHFVHIEVLSNDVRMPAFLDNPGKITAGKQYIRIHSGKSIYQKAGTGAASTFKAMSCVIVKDSGKILPADKCYPLKDAQGKTWYEISPGNWMSESDVDVLHQYDLKERGFTALKEESTADMSKSLREGWMKAVLNRLSEMVNRERGIQQQQVSDYYKKVVNNIDTDGDGELSSEELFYAVHHPEMEIRNITARMVVKHDSEWSGDSSHHKWEVYFKNYDLLRMKYAKQWRDDMEWMSQVEAFKRGGPVWHMHPVIFLSALSQVQKKNIIFPLKVKPKNDVEGVWKRYYWAAALTDANASQAIFGRDRSGGARKHAARDLYTDPSTEIVAVSNGVVKNISHYYYGTWQVTVEHTIDDGRHFYIRYGEVDPKSIVVKVGDHLTQGMIIAKTGLMINPATGQHPNILPGEVVYMLHFEYYPGNATTPPPNNTPTPPYHRREDLCDPLDILQEGYWNTFCDGVSNTGERIPISNLSVSNDGEVFIKGWEGFKSKAYNDSEGFCTIGYGHLIARAKCEEITLPNEFKSEITMAKADELFESRLSVYVDELKRTVTVNLYQYEFDALISLLFNLGRMSKAPQLNSKLNIADYNGAATEFLDITNGGVSGLVKRRQKEQGLFLNGVYDSSH